MPKLSDDAKGLTGSRVAAALGLSKWATENDTLEESYQAAMGSRSAFGATHVMDFGNAVEQWTLERSLEGMPFAIQHPGPFLEADNLQCSVDALAIALDAEPTVIESGKFQHTPNHAPLTIEGDGVLEAKYTSASAVYGGPPPFWHGPSQVYSAMACSDASWGAVAINFAGRETHTWFLERDEAVIAEILEVAADFKERLGELTASNGVHGWFPLASSADGETVFPVAEENDELVELNSDACETFVDLVAGKQMIECGKEIVDRCEASLKEALQSRARGRVLLENPLKTSKSPDGSAEWIVAWPMRHYRATAEETKVTPAKEARSVRQSTLTVRPVP